METEWTKKSKYSFIHSFVHSFIYSVSTVSQLIHSFIGSFILFFTTTTWLFNSTQLFSAQSACLSVSVSLTNEYGRDFVPVTWIITTTITTSNKLTQKSFKKKKTRKKHENKQSQVELINWQSQYSSVQWTMGGKWCIHLADLKNFIHFSWQ